jgi:hypothetical protein
MTEGSIVNLVVPNEVVDVAGALARLDQGWFRRRFNELYSLEYPSRAALDDDVERFWSMLEELRQFYGRAAESNRAVVFYTDDSLDVFFRGPT